MVKTLPYPSEELIYMKLSGSNDPGFLAEIFRIHEQIVTFWKPTNQEQYDITSRARREGINAEKQSAVAMKERGPRRILPQMLSFL